MDEVFETNRIHPSDPNFKYDVAVDFPEQMETNDWDSEASEGWWKCLPNLLISIGQKDDWEK